MFLRAELIGIQIPGLPPTYTLAVIRWINDTSGEGLQAGLQILATKVETVTIMNHTQLNSLPIHCLLLPELKSTNIQASLITPPLAFRINDFEKTLLFKQGKIERQIRLIELLESSGAFTRFSFIFQ